MDIPVLPEPSPLIASFWAGTDVLPEKELARQLKKSVRAVRAWRTHRIGPPWFKVGKSVFYHRSAVLAWCALQAEERQPIRSKRK